MAQIKRGKYGDSFGERLPWLEPVEDDYDPGEGGGFGKLILLIVAVLAAVGIAVAAFIWWRDARAHQAAIGSVIHAPPGPYKTRPADPGGMSIASAGAVAERTSTGSDINSPLDLAAIPEQPITGPGSAEGTARPVPVAAPAVPPAVVPVVRAPAPAPTAAPAPAKALIPATPLPPPVPKVRPAPAVTAVVAAPTGAAGAIQLGAFSSDAKARAAWTALAKRFASLAGLSEAIQPVPSGDATLYRLRASGPGAAKICAQLKVAGETCAIL